MPPDKFSNISSFEKRELEMFSSPGVSSNVSQARTGVRWMQINNGVHGKIWRVTKGDNRTQFPMFAFFLLDLLKICIFLLILNNNLDAFARDWKMKNEGNSS